MVCYEDCPESLGVSKCGDDRHFLCYKCYWMMPNAICPICRKKVPQIVMIYKTIIHKGKLVTNLKCPPLLIQEK